MKVLFYYCFKVNTGQTSGRRGLDLNVEPVWVQGITGNGVVVSIMDDGKYVHVYTDIIIATAWRSTVVIAQILHYLSHTTSQLYNIFSEKHHVIFLKSN